MKVKRTLLALFSICLVGAVALAQTAPKTSGQKATKSSKAVKPAMDRMGKPHDPSDEQFLKAAYRCLFAREAAPSDLAIWKPKLQAGTPREQVYREMFLSPEYAALQRADADFVKDAYHAYFGREADPVGSQNWTNALSSGSSRETVLEKLAASEEFRFPGGRLVKPCSKGEEFVRQAYWTVLNREPDPAGLSSHTGGLQRGETREQILKTLFLSEEYQKAKPTDEAFLRDAYRAILAREGDGAGIQGYLGTLRKAEKDWKAKLGGTEPKAKARTQVLDTMFASEEYKKLRANCK